MHRKKNNKNKQNKHIHLYAASYLWKLFFQFADFPNIAMIFRQWWALCVREHCVTSVSAADGQRGHTHRRPSTLRRMEETLPLWEELRDCHLRWRFALIVLIVCCFLTELCVSPPTSEGLRERNETKCHSWHSLKAVSQAVVWRNTECSIHSALKVHVCFVSDGLCCTSQWALIPSFTVQVKWRLLTPLKNILHISIPEDITKHGLRIRKKILSWLCREI